MDRFEAEATSSAKTALTQATEYALEELQRDEHRAMRMLLVAFAESSDVSYEEAVRWSLLASSSDMNVLDAIYNKLGDQINDVRNFWNEHQQLSLDSDDLYQTRVIPQRLDPVSEESARELLKRSGGIVNLIKNTALITNKKYHLALTPLSNQHAYIQQLDKKFFDQLEFHADTGTMTMKDDFTQRVMIQHFVTRNNIPDLDLQLLRTLYSIIYLHGDSFSQDTVTIYLPTLCKHMGINIRGDKPNDLFRKIRAFDNVIGVLDNGSFYRLLVFLGYDQQTNSISFGSPYMNRVLQRLQEENTFTIEKGKRKGQEFTAPYHSFLIHGTIANERNKPAIEIVCSIVTLLQQRGDALPTNEGDISLIKAHKSFQGIINDIPLLKESLEAPAIDISTQQPKPKTRQQKNDILSRAFKRAYVLLKEKTDVYRYYLNLKVYDVIPTASTLDMSLVITHEGKNPNYRS